MIYIVVEGRTDAAYMTDYRNICASPSRALAEIKMKELQSKAVLQTQAYQEYLLWCEEYPYSDAIDKDKWAEQLSITLDFIQKKYGIDNAMHNASEYFIDEVEEI